MPRAEKAALACSILVATALACGGGSGPASPSGPSASASCPSTSAPACTSGTFGYPTTHTLTMSGNGLVAIDGGPCTFKAIDTCAAGFGCLCIDRYECQTYQPGSWVSLSYSTRSGWTVGTAFVTCAGGGGGRCGGTGESCSNPACCNGTICCGGAFCGGNCVGTPCCT